VGSPKEEGRGLQYQPPPIDVLAIPLSLADYHKEAVVYTNVSRATGFFVTANTVERARAA
jgi:hypothetical protein